MEELTLPQRLLELIRNNLLISILFAVGLICLSVGLIQYFAPKPEEIEFIATSQASAVEEEESSLIFVDVSGQVKTPGIYEFTSKERIKDALDRAGGLADDADYDYVSKNLNQAAKLTDGMKIYIPSQGEKEASILISSGTGQTTHASGQSFTSINTASMSELESLPGIGPVTAEKIISKRPYAQVEELVSKKAIGESLFSKIKDQIGL